ncbi:MAG: penicillin-binding protein 2 [Lactobacillales bacterium]|jgi:penicillin-binding protein 2B|nr:penicillin-binding protein 2 [Lactobacillales bacterium]
MKVFKFFSKKSVSESKQELTKKFLEGKRSHILFRLNLLFFVIFVLFISLIVRLTSLQIIDNKRYEERAVASNQQVVQTSYPRGQIYDAKGAPLVTNIARPAIVYTRGRGISSQKLRKIALKLVELVKIAPDDHLTERDKKDFWLADKGNEKLARKRLNDNELRDKKGEVLSASKLYSKIVDKVSKAEINFNEKDLAAATVFKRMNNAPEFSTVTIIDKNISEGDLAVVGENEGELSGISTSTNWERNYVEDSAIRSILGGISSEKAGLPAEKLKEYLKKGYLRNDRVGIAYLEEQYESVLKGQKEKTELIFDKGGKVAEKRVIQAGEKGKNLKLSLNMEFQKKVEEALEQEFSAVLNGEVGERCPGAYVVAIDPRNGAIQAIAGVSRNMDEKNSEVNKDALGAIGNVYPPGSIIKGATITAGYETGVISGNETLQDIPIKLRGTPAKQSIFYKDYPNRMLTAVAALENSSNSYMMQVALRILGVSYHDEMSLPTNNKDNAYKKLRTAFHHYGLGVKTGIDLPNESSGFEGSTKVNGAMGKFLDLSFGQYDSYTTLQLAQYAATIANGGKRLEPHIVEEIYQSDLKDSLGKLEKKIKPNVLNTVPISKDEMDVIRTGFYQVVHGHDFHTTASSLKSNKIDISAKTGTAEMSETADGAWITNMSVAAFAPSSDPQLAVAVMFPNVKIRNYKYNPNLEVARKIFEVYHDMYMKD